MERKAKKMTDREIYSSATPEAKRRLAAELLEFKIKKSGYRDPNFLHEWCSETYYFKEEFKFIVGDFRPDESLDQCRILENKAKEDEKVWRSYEMAIEDAFCPSDCTENSTSTGLEVSFAYPKILLLLTPDEKLFCLFQAFGVLEKLNKEGQGK